MIGEKYNKPLNMLIANVKMSTSKNVLCKGSRKSNISINGYLITKKMIFTNCIGILQAAAFGGEAMWQYN